VNRYLLGIATTKPVRFLHFYLESDWVR